MTFLTKNLLAAVLIGNLGLAGDVIAAGGIGIYSGGGNYNRNNTSCTVGGGYSSNPYAPAHGRAYDPAHNNDYVVQQAGDTPLHAARS